MHRLKFLYSSDRKSRMTFSRKIDCITHPLFHFTFIATLLAPSYLTYQKSQKVMRLTEQRVLLMELRARLMELRIRLTKLGIGIYKVVCFNKLIKKGKSLFGNCTLFLGLN